MESPELWKNLKAGQKEALGKIYQTHVDVLIQYGSRFTSNIQMVEDCIQDLFVELWKNRNGLGETTAIKPYLMASLRRKIYRKNKKANLVVSDDHDAYLPFEVTQAFEQKLIEKEVSEEQVKKLKSALTSLSKRQQEVIYLKYYAGLDYEDIEAVMSINYQSIRNLVSTALKKLKDTISSNAIFQILLTFLIHLSVQ